MRSANCSRHYSVCFPPADLPYHLSVNAAPPFRGPELFSLEASYAHTDVLLHYSHTAGVR
jgi:hypothetical protein